MLRNLVKVFIIKRSISFSIFYLHLLCRPKVCSLDGDFTRLSVDDELLTKCGRCIGLLFGLFRFVPCFGGLWGRLVVSLSGTSRCGALPVKLTLPRLGDVDGPEDDSEKLNLNPFSLLQTFKPTSLHTLALFLFPVSGFPIVHQKVISFPIRRWEVVQTI